MEALSRRKFSAILEVCRPLEVQWKPPLRQAAGTLAAIGSASTVPKQDSKNPQKIVDKIFH
jgi:hypothetical protein